MTDLINTTRRDLLTGLGLAAVGAAVAPYSYAGSSQPLKKYEGVYTPPGLPQELSETAGTHPKAIFKQNGALDFNNPADYKLARLKILQSLSGDRTYFSTMARHILCPPGEVPYPLVNQLEVTSMFLERPKGMDSNSAVIQSVFTRIPIDPVTFQPVYELYIPYLDKTVSLTDTLFAGFGFELNLDGDAPVDPIIQSDKPFYEFGDDVGFVMFDPRKGKGDFQPRIDTVVWRAKKDDLMDPSKGTIDADYTYTALMKASVFKWTQIPDGDPTQVLTMKTGHKSVSYEALPAQVKDLIANKYPDRF